MKKNHLFFCCITLVSCLLSCARQKQENDSQNPMLVKQRNWAKVESIAAANGIAPVFSETKHSLLMYMTEVDMITTMKSDEDQLVIDGEEFAFSQNAETVKSIKEYFETIDRFKSLKVFYFGSQNDFEAVRKQALSGEVRFCIPNKKHPMLYPVEMKDATSALPID